MRWWLNPFNLYRTARDARRVASGGGPVALRLKSIGHPRGWIFPASTVSLEVVGKDGGVTPFEPQFPVPFPFAWSYRLARMLGVPLISDLKPEWFSTELKVPGRSAGGS
jgi:hypothetical protein